MLKVAMLAAALLVVASTAAVEKAFPEPPVATADPASCHSDASTVLACTPRAIDADGTVSTAELVNLVVPAAPVADWMPWHPAPELGPDFKDAAAEPGSVLPKSVDRQHPQSALPALFALGALLVLLRRRPA